MLKNISWTNYIAFIVIVSILYYLVIGLMFYWSDMKDITSGRRSLIDMMRNKKHNVLIRQGKNADYAESNSDILLTDVSQFIAEIRSSFRHAEQENLIKQELIFSLQQITKKYAQFKASSYERFISNYLLAESLNYGSVQLSEDDIDQIWAK